MSGASERVVRKAFADKLGIFLVWRNYAAERWENGRHDLSYAF